MDHCPLDITVISASGLKNVNLFMKMGVYVAVSLLTGNSVTKQQTHVSKGGKNPLWSHRLKFLIEKSATQNSTLIFMLMSRRVLGDRIIGEVSIPVRELLECAPGSETKEHVVEYQVRSIRGKARGSLTFSHKFKDKIPARNNMNNGNKDSVNTTYPPCNVYAMPQQGTPSYPHAQAPYPPAQGYNGYQGQQPQYGGTYAQPYIHQQQQMGHGYNQSQPSVVAPSKPKDKKGSKFGLGLAGGLIGGLLVGDMVSDAMD